MLSYTSFVGPGLFERQKSIPLVHELVKLEAGFRADVIIENKLLIEFKSLKN